MGDMERLDMGGERREEDGVILKGHERCHLFIIVGIEARPKD